MTNQGSGITKHFSIIDINVIDLQKVFVVWSPLDAYLEHFVHSVCVGRPVFVWLIQIFCNCVAYAAWNHVSMGWYWAPNLSCWVLAQTKRGTHTEKWRSFNEESSRSSDEEFLWPLCLTHTSGEWRAILQWLVMWKHRID